MRTLSTLENKKTFLKFNTRFLHKIKKKVEEMERIQLIKNGG